MKTVRKILAFTFLTIAMAMAFAAPALSQGVDSTAAGPEVVSSIFGISIPSLIRTAIIALLLVLPAVQLVLKRIPTNGSVKIQGLLGKVLDFLTFFQKDKIVK